jgi:membrane protein
MLRLLSIGLGIAISTLLFFAMYKLLPRPELPNRALLEGALLAAVVFEGLKLVATTLIAFSLRSPTAAVAGTFVVLLVWINYFSRLIFFGGSWAATTPVAARALPELREQATD